MFEYILKHKYKFIIGMIGTILSTALPSAVGIKKENKIEQLSKESASKSYEIKSMEDKNLMLTSQIEDLNISRNSLASNYNSLMRDYTQLQEKYSRCISSEGAINTVGSISIETYGRQLKTGDKLEFDLVEKSLQIIIVRISNDGPVIAISGCEEYITEYEIILPSENNEINYLITSQSPLLIQFTSSSCEDGDDIEPDQMEEISLSVNRFNVDEQTVYLEFNRRFLF